MIALIDGDIVVYRAAFGAETTTDWGDDDDTVTVSGSKFETRSAIDKHVEEIKEATGATRVLMVFSDKKNFRKDVYPGYKANRIQSRKPVTFSYGRNYVEKTYQTMFRPGLEADDCLGILATGEVAGFMDERVVCSTDKDMKSFPCKLYNWAHPEAGVVEITPEDADFFFFMQALMGDNTDGYPGCPGIGPVKAERLLLAALEAEPVESRDDHAVMWKAVVKAYAEKGLDEEHALMMARCARILRAEDYDFVKKSPIFWVAPKGETDNG